ncbi:decarboxylase, partial [Thraustotheca clavata]
IESEDWSSVASAVHAALPEGAFTHLHWAALVDFDMRVVHATATYTLGVVPVNGLVPLEVNALTIRQVLINGVESANQTVSSPLPTAHSMLLINLPPQTMAPFTVSITYSTAPNGLACHWLEDTKSSDGGCWLVTQSYPSYASALLPIPASLCMKYPYTAEITTLASTIAVVSAPTRGAAPTIAENGMQTWTYRQTIAVPSYALALVVAPMELFSLAPQMSTLFATEDIEIEATFDAVSQLPLHLELAEALTGHEFVWSELNIVIVPAEFCFQTALYPCLVVTTQACLTRSLLVESVARHWISFLAPHETWQDVWLSEGWAKYLWLELLKQLDGSEVETTELVWSGYNQLCRAFDIDTPANTRLRMNHHSMDRFSIIAREKGYLCLLALQAMVGKDTFDFFVSAYISGFETGSVTSEEFKMYCEEYFTLVEDIPITLEWETWYHALVDLPSPVSISDWLQQPIDPVLTMDITQLDYDTLSELQRQLVLESLFLKPTCDFEYVNAWSRGEYSTLPQWTSLWKQLHIRHREWRYDDPQTIPNLVNYVSSQANIFVICEVMAEIQNYYGINIMMDVWEGCKEIRDQTEFPYHPVVLQRVSALMPPPSPIHIAPINPVVTQNNSPPVDTTTTITEVVKEKSLPKPKRFKRDDNGSAQWMAVAIGVCKFDDPLSFLTTASALNLAWWDLMIPNSCGTVIHRNDLPHEFSFLLLPPSSKMSSLHLDLTEVIAAAIESVHLGAAHQAAFANEPADARGDLTFSTESPLVQASLRYHQEDAPNEAAGSMNELLEYIKSNLHGPASGFNANTDTFLAYVLGGVLPQANVIDYYINSIDPTTIAWSKAPLIHRLEINVVHWFCGFVGYPRDTSLGIFTQGASSANFDAGVIARVKKFPRNRNIHLGTIYLSAATHFCNARGARMAGILPENCRFLPVDKQGRIDTAALATALENDVANGLVPYLIVANIGTTSLGAVDDLHTMADLAEKYQCHLHCDGALGGFFLLTERGQEWMDGIHRSDSVSFDFHKGMALPYATSLLVVKNKDDLINGFSANDDMDYLKKEADSRFGIGTQEEFDHDLVTFADCSPDLSRACKGIKVWWLIQVHGLNTWRNHFNHLLDVADKAREVISKIEGICLGPGGLNVVNFRVDFNGDIDQINAATDEILDKINKRQKVFISMATYMENGNKYATARACFQNHNVTMDTVDKLVDEIKIVLPTLTQLNP